MLVKVIGPGAVGALFLGCLDKQYGKLFSFVDEGEVTMKFESQMSQMSLKWGSHIIPLFRNVQLRFRKDLATN